MVDLMIERFINVHDSFKKFGKIYRVINEKDDDFFICDELDKYNYVKRVEMHKNDIPLHFPIWDYRIINPEEFIPGRPVFLYKKTVDNISKLNGILIRCTNKQISFIYRCMGGEVLNGAFTARQIAIDSLIIQMYEEPKIF